MCTRTQEKGAGTLQETDQICPWVSKCLRRRCGSTVARCRVGGTECISAYMGPFEGGHHYLHYLHHSLASGQTTGRENSPAHQQKIGIKNLLSMALPIRTRPSFPLGQSLPLGSFHKPSPSESRLNENHNHRKLIKLITRTTTLSNLMNVWAMPCRAMFSRQVRSSSPWPMHSSTPGFPVPDRFPKFAQVCVHLVGDVIQPSHPLEFLKNDYLHKGNNIFQEIHGSGFFFFAFPFLYCPFFPSCFSQISDPSWPKSPGTHVGFCSPCGLLSLSRETRLGDRGWGGGGCGSKGRRAASALAPRMRLSNHFSSVSVDLGP